MPRGPSKEALQETFAFLGLALHMLHGIESHFAQATLLGLTERQKRKHRTVSDLWKAREKMTFGQMVLLFKEDWELDPDFEKLLDEFVSERNFIVHRITAEKGFGIASARDRRKLNARLATFIDKTYFMSEFFHGAYVASLEFARHMVRVQRNIDIPVEPPREWQERKDMFLALVKYRHGT